MRIEVRVPETWTTVNLDMPEVFEAIEAAAEDGGETNQGVKRIINRYYGFLRRVPDAFIADYLTAREREIISNAFREQAERFAGCSGPSSGPEGQK